MIKNSSQKFDNLVDSEDYQVWEKIRKVKSLEREWQSIIEVPEEICRII